MLWLALLVAALPAKQAAAGKTAYVWLWYADGSAIPTYSQYCGDLTPPAYKCNFGSSLDNCKSQVQSFLDKWYEDFNLVFTLTRPPSHDYYTIVITSGWPQCQAEVADLTGGVAADEGGVAPGNCVNNFGTALAIECEKNAHDCATIIAHEHAHLVGLVHTTNPTDVMYPSVRSASAGFVDETMTVAQDTASACVAGKPTQNSYQQMLSALGAWPGGPKPSPFTDAPDAAAYAPTTDAGASPDTSSGSSVGPNPTPSTDDGSVVFVGGEDAWVRPTISRDDAAAAGSGSRAGCDLGASRRSNPFSAAAVLMILLLAVRRRSSERRG
jgi:Matrixin